MLLLICIVKRIINCTHFKHLCKGTYLNKNIHITIGGINHYCDGVLKVAGSGPLISVKEEELNLVEDPEFCVKINGKIETIPKYPIFLKHNGKYVVLVGKELIDEQKKGKRFSGLIEGKLVSSVALKKARVN